MEKDLQVYMTVDSFLFLWKEFVREFEYIYAYRNFLAVIGTFYLTKTAINVISSIIRNVATHGLSRFFPLHLPSYGKWAVVTGPTEGIGRAFAEELAKRGMSVLLVGRNSEKLEELSKLLKSDYNQETKIVIIDFDNPGRDYEKVKEAFGSIEIGIVVNNVGSINKYPAFLYEMNDDEIMTMLHVNIESVTKMTKLAVEHMRKQKNGFIINISSIASLAPAPLLQVYAATKAYVTSFSRAIQEEVKGDGITVQTLIPSYINTRMVGYSQRLKSSWFVPSPQTYVESAFRTLRFSSYTTGYWLHGVQAFFVSLLPETWYMRMIRKTNVAFRNEYLAQRVNENS